MRSFTMSSSLRLNPRMMSFNSTSSSSTTSPRLTTTLDSYDLYPHPSFQSLQPNPSKLRSPYSRFRSNRAILSVSDLVSCLWCQVQTEYGLLSKRYLRPSERPSSFLSSSGLQINVDPHSVISRQNILDRGLRVHSRLEQEVSPDKIHVKLITQVDAWGLKIINTIISLILLRSNRMMREIRVLGFIGGFLVQGIIDQIDLVPVQDHSSSSASKLSPDSKPNSRPHRSHHPARAQPTSTGTTGSKNYSLRISDSKTTHRSELPPPQFTESARYQLMLYKFLHDQNASGSFDVERFGRTLGLDLDEPFSPEFSKDTESLVSDNLKGIDHSNEFEGREKEVKPTTLRGLFRVYHRLIGLIGVTDPTLEIVYRQRSGARARNPHSIDRRPTRKKTKLDGEVEKVTTRPPGDDLGDHHSPIDPPQSSSSTHRSSFDLNPHQSQQPEVTSSSSIDSVQGRLASDPSTAHHEQSALTSCRPPASSSIVSTSHDHKPQAEDPSPSSSGTRSSTSWARISQDSTDRERLVGDQSKPQDLGILRLTPGCSVEELDLDKSHVETSPASQIISINSLPSVSVSPPPQVQSERLPSLNFADERSYSTKQPTQKTVVEEIQDRIETDDDIESLSRILKGGGGTKMPGLRGKGKLGDGGSDDKLRPTTVGFETKGRSSSSMNSMRPNYDRRSQSKDIVGSYEFEYDTIEFESFVIRSIEFWNGDTEPVGVGIEDAAKCSSCEYKQDCEWRAKMSNQIIASALSSSSYGPPTKVKASSMT